MKLKLITTAIALSYLLLAKHSYSEETSKNIKEEIIFSKHWLLNEKDYEKRTIKLEKYLRGFDQPMLEVGQRYASMQQALQDKNYDFANYQWKKIKKTINNGLMKRPARSKNAHAILLNITWDEVSNDIASKNEQRARHGFSKARAACIACHIAENMAYINNQPLFKIK